ncbi:MAG: hypothetical protein GY770_03635, partial [Aestuariibacter sp.]|nr:hypothetical protein [Aestuariibacter sp.]
GKPLTVHRISADLNRGLYLLVAYGGESLPWAETSNDQPFHLRMGIPKVAGAGIDYKTTSPFGYDRWLVPASTDYYRLELEKNAPAAISVTEFDDSYAFSRSGRSEQITKESRLPVAEVFTSKGRDNRWEVATITANAGQAYVFQRFSAKKRQVIDERGTYWVSTLHSGYGEDSADATSILTDSTHHRETFVDSRTISLDTSSGWQRRFNILDTLTLYFKVSHQGDYRVEANGIEGEFRFEPFTTDRGTNYKTPKARTLGSNWELDPGFYVLTIIPDRDARGVATLSVYANQKKPVNDSPAHIASRYKSIKIKWNQRYTVYLNRQPDVTSGILVRKYPIDLSQSMPLTLNPGEELSLSVSIPRNGELTAITEDGSLAKFTLKESTSSKDLPQKHNGDRYDVQYGVYVVSLKNHSENARNYQLQFTEASQLESVALPAFNQNLVQHLDFPELTLQQPRFFDLGKKQWAAFNVIVSEPGLYQLESTGLLETRGIIRTRVITRLDGQSANGVGRNFLIQQYLREGSYQLALATEGDTKGHLGAQLKRTSLIDGGQITAGKAARYSLPSGEGLLYHFEIKKAGQYQLQSFGINGNFKVRLEDGDGWPLIKPGQKSNLDLNLRAGKYRLVVLPTELPVRVVTLLKREPSPVS